MFKIVAAPIVVLVLFLTYTIHSHDISTREIHEHSHDITIYSKAKCSYCTKATEFLDKEKVHYHEVDVTWDEKHRIQLAQNTGSNTVPYVFVDGKYIGGYSDLITLAKKGGLK